MTLCPCLLGHRLGDLRYGLNSTPSSGAWRIGGRVMNRPTSHRLLVLAFCVLVVSCGCEQEPASPLRLGATALAGLKDPTIKPIDQVTARFFRRMAYDLNFGGIATAGEEGEVLVPSLEHLGAEADDAARPRAPRPRCRLRLWRAGAHRIATLRARRSDGYQRSGAGVHPLQCATQQHRQRRMPPGQPFRSGCRRALRPDRLQPAFRHRALFRLG